MKIDVVIGYDVIYYILPENVGFGWFIYDLFFFVDCVWFISVNDWFR